MHFDGEGKAKQNLNLKIQMFAGKGTIEFFERLYKNLTSLDKPIQKSS